MGRIAINCKFITPAFIYGANNELELRAPSIKGLMRFWWRAVNEFSSIEEMRNRESEIFGGKLIVNGKEKFVKAKVQILTKLIKNTDLESNRSSSYKYKHYDGIKYLFYSVKGKKIFHEGIQFQVIFKFKDEDKQYVKEYLKGFNALQLFMGIGGRSRRGGGNFIVEEIADIFGISEEEILTNLYVEKNSNDIVDAYKKLFKYNNSTCELSYSNIINESAKVYLLTFNNKSLRPNNFNFEDNFNKVAKKYKDYRRKNTFNKCNNRGASPLIIKIVKDGEECKILLVKLSGERIKYYGKEDKSKKNRRDNENNKQNEEDKIVDEFFKEFLQKNNRNEIDIINLWG